MSFASAAGTAFRAVLGIVIVMVAASLLSVTSYITHMVIGAVVIIAGAWLLGMMMAVIATIVNDRKP